MNLCQKDQGFKREQLRLLKKRKIVIERGGSKGVWKRVLVEKELRVRKLALYGLRKLRSSVSLRINNNDNFNDHSLSTLLHQLLLNFLDLLDHQRIVLPLILISFRCQVLQVA
jgi:hypothetical protein